MTLLLDDDKSIDELAWGWQDEVEYNHLKLRYSNRKELSQQAQDKYKALKDVVPRDPMYHRMAVSAEMASLRVDMAYIVDKNNKLEEMLGTVAFIHQRLDILEGSYSYIKMLAEGGRIDYATLTRIVKDIEKLKEEQINAIKQRSDRPDGAEG